MKIRLVSLAILLALTASLVFGSKAIAAKGTPDSPEFGYGAQIHVEGDFSGDALAIAKNLKLDWVNIEFNWTARWPTAGASPVLTDLDQAMQIAREDGLSVMLSLTNPPAWACSPHGPDPETAARLVVALAERYPMVLAGVELFPAANTVAGWGALPNPAGYLNLFRTVDNELRANALEVNLVAAGLTPLAADAPAQDMDDLVFLTGLYSAGAADAVSILSVRFDDLTGDPLQMPGAGTHQVLRHYEEVRRVMLAHGHTRGIVWITRFSAPSGTIQPSDAKYRQPEKASAWMSQAYRQLRAQLYIGAAFIADLNPGSTEPAGTSSLIGRDGSRQPFIDILGRLIAQNNQPLETSSAPMPSSLQLLIGTSS
jgi:hypothetical protein